MTRHLSLGSRCAALAALLLLTTSCTSRELPATATARTFSTANEAVQALIDGAKAGDVTELIALFGPGANELIQSSDAALARRNREVFVAAAARGWSLTDNAPDNKTLVIGDEQWPFPIPLVMEANRWRFDTEAGKEEIIDRRIGRNELAAIQVCRTYVIAQRVYASHPRDAGRAGIYAAAFRSDPGKQNGLYWKQVKGKPRSPIGDLVAQATIDARGGSTGGAPPPFRGYYFKILTSQGPAARGGAKDYIVGGAMTSGFALVAWPAQYDITGVMTFIVSQDGVVHEKDLGPATSDVAGRMTRYDPDESWARVP
jgi:hypothetical protein